MNNFSKIEKYAIVNILSRIMRADGIFNHREEEYMNQIYLSFSISIKDLEDISNIDDIQAIYIVRKMSEEKKVQAISLFTGMAKADGIIHPKETEIMNLIFK